MCVILLQGPAGLDFEEGELPGSSPEFSNFQVTSIEVKGHKQGESFSAFCNTFMSWNLFQKPDIAY